MNEVNNPKKAKEKPKYSIWQNVCFMVRTAWSCRKSVLVICLVTMVLEVLLKLAQLFIAPQILQKVEQSAPLSELLWTIVLFSGACFVLRFMVAYVEENRQAAQIDVRSRITSYLNVKACTTSYPNSRDPKVLKLQEQACAA
ncbi:MAG: ABC transporter ATP-binding protein, partial [Lachnospiraceae bacterium]|nr:ABC transporter ATP-binding protein [Lachnospiraceae bacterium]